MRKGACDCASRTELATVRAGELTVFTCPSCIAVARRFHGDGQLELFTGRERESSVSAVLIPEDVEKNSREGRKDLTLGQLPF